MKGPRWVWRRYFGSCPGEVYFGLSELTGEFPSCSRHIGDALLYAQIGRDRGLLDMSYVQTVRDSCEMFSALSERHQQKGAA